MFGLHILALSYFIHTLEIKHYYLFQNLKLFLVLLIQLCPISVAL